MELMARLEAGRAGYREDFAAWADAQAALLRAGRYGDADWPSIIEEIEGLSGSERSALSSQVLRILEHLIKLLVSPAIDPRQGWSDTIIDARVEIEKIIDTSPSLTNQIDAMVAQNLPRAIRLVSRKLENYGELTPQIVRRVSTLSFTTDQILGDWFPDA